MAVSYKDDKDQDERLNPGGQARDLYRQEQAASDYKDNLDDHPVTAGDASGVSGDLSGGRKDNTSNIANAKSSEEEGPWKNNVSAASGGKKKTKGVLRLLNRKGPLALIGGSILGGGVMFSFLTSGAVFFMQIKNTLLDKLNDPLAAMDVRTTAFISNKIGNDVTKGVCTRVTIACRYATMSTGQVKKLEKDGIIKVNGDRAFGINRVKVSTIEYKGEKLDAAAYRQKVKADPEFRRTLLSVYNPKFAGFADSAWQRFANVAKIFKGKNVNSSAKEEDMRKDFAEAASGEAGARVNAKLRVEEDSKGVKTYFDDSTQPPTAISEARYNELFEASRALDAELVKRAEISKVTEEATKGTIKSTLTVTALGLGAADKACSAYMLIRTAGMAAKYIGQLQLARAFHADMNTIDTIPGGDATPEVLSWLGKTFNGNPNSEGKTYTDSVGYKNAAYGDTNMPSNDGVGKYVTDVKSEGLNEKDAAQVVLNNEATRYVNGQIVSSSIIAQFISFFDKGNPGNVDKADSTCGFIKSGWGQGILIGASVVGAVAAFFSGGLTLGWGVGIQAAVGVGIGIAMAILTPKLIDMAAGNLVTGYENSNERGNIDASGAGANNDLRSQVRGMPVLTKENAGSYLQLASDVRQEYAAVERLELSPFDASSKNTFLGSIVSNYLPYTSKLTTIGGGVTSTLGVAFSSLASLVSPASKAVTTHQKEFEVCQDPETKEMGTATTIFCSNRHGFAPQALGINPSAVEQYMRPYVDDMTGQPKDNENEYAKHIKNCFDRDVAIGAFTEENGSKGKECIAGTRGADEEKYTMFELFYFDQPINSALDDGYNAGAEPAPSNDTGTVVPDGKWTNPGTFTYTITNPYGPNHTGIDLAGNGVFSSACDGTITSIDNKGEKRSPGVSGTSNIMRIDCGGGITAKYFHYYYRDLEPGIKVGVKVQSGTKLAKVGNQGNTVGRTGIHLHFEIEQNGTIVDPAKFMQKMGVKF